MYKTGSSTTATTEMTTTTPKICYLGKMDPMKVSWLLKQREHEFNVKIRSLSVCPTLSLSASNFVFVCLCLYLCLGLSNFFSVCLCLSLSLSLLLSDSVSVCLSSFLPLSDSFVFFSLSYSPCLLFRLSFSLSPAPSVCLSVSVILPFSLSIHVPVCLYASPSLPPSLQASRSFFVSAVSEGLAVGST